MHQAVLGMPNLLDSGISYSASVDGLTDPFMFLVRP